MGRAKALGVLLLPIIAFVAVVFLASAIVRVHPAGVTKKPSEPTPISADGLALRGYRQFFGCVCRCDEGIAGNTWQRRDNGDDLHWNGQVLEQ